MAIDPNTGTNVPPYFPQPPEPQRTFMPLFGNGQPTIILLRGADPTVAAGVDAALGSLGLYTDGASVGRLYVKTGPLAMDWTLK